MTETMVPTTEKMNKTDILNKISESEILNAIFNLYKDAKTEGHVYKLDSSKYSGMNGLLGSIYVFTLKDKIMDIIVPLFSTERTVTWNFSYNTILAETLKDYELAEHDITKLAKAAIFYLNKTNNDVDFMTVVNVSDWISNGLKGSNGKSVYYWNEQLPNGDGLTKGDIKSEIFVKMLPNWSNKKLMEICTDYANENFKKFATNSATRTDKTKVRNIAKGLYAQIKVYLQLKNDGYDVDMTWSNKDDLGIDITWKTNDTKINIDVKSTSDEFLKISRFRKETDFYAIVKWEKSNPVLIGFINKFEFWQSNLLDTKAPVKDEKSGLYVKKLTKKWMKSFLKIDKVFDNLMKYQALKVKSKAKLFDVE